MKSHRTLNDMKSNAKTVSIEILNARLADSIDLALLTKQAHWNIKGPQFIALHEMIDTFRTTIDGHVDTMAERIVQLGAQRSARRKSSRSRARSHLTRRISTNLRITFPR